MHRVTMPKIFQPWYCEDLVRLGKNNDGGYLVSLTDVKASNFLLSLGVGGDCSFETDFAQVSDSDVTAYDAAATINAEFLDFFQNKHKHIPYNIGLSPGEVTFRSAMAGRDNIFLKCDIDGAEYNILGDIIDHCHKFTGMVIEFHAVNTASNFNLLTNFISKIPHRLVHTHVNNYFYYKTPSGNMPDILELSFSAQTDLKYLPELTLPHKLDQPNNHADQDFGISF